MKPDQNASKEEQTKYNEELLRLSQEEGSDNEAHVKILTGLADNITRLRTSFKNHSPIEIIGPWDNTVTEIRLTLQECDLENIGAK